MANSSDLTNGKFLSNEELELRISFLKLLLVKSFDVASDEIIAKICWQGLTFDDGVEKYKITPQKINKARLQGELFGRFKAKIATALHVKEAEITKANIGEVLENAYIYHGRYTKIVLDRWGKICFLGIPNFSSHVTESFVTVKLKAGRSEIGV